MRVAVTSSDGYCIYGIVTIIIYANTMEHRCGQCRCNVSAYDLKRSMCRPSKIDVSTFEDRCVDHRRSTCRPSEIDVSTFEDRRSMCRPSKIDDRCVDLRRSMIDVSTVED